MRKALIYSILCLSLNTTAQGNLNEHFNAFKDRFLDAFWMYNPSYAIAVGYGKYYERLDIPDSVYFARMVAFSKQWLDSLEAQAYKNLDKNNQISYNLIKNQLQSTLWYIDTFKDQQWDPSIYNLGAECYDLITSPYAPLDERLQTLSKHIAHADLYYAAALKGINQPTKEHLDLAIQQNEGALQVFGSSLSDSINVSHISSMEKDTLQQHILITTNAIKEYIAGLKRIQADKSYTFRSFRIGEKLFNQKFHYDIVSDFTANEIYNKALATKKSYHKEMYIIANKLWSKYCNDVTKPKDSLRLIRAVLDKISLQHASPSGVFDTLNKHLHDLKKFIVEKNLFDFDTTSPIVVRKMPAFVSGVSSASADFPLPYLKQSIAYYNIADLSALPADEAESQLREDNNYMLQILSIHEGIPGHCMQGIYNSSKSPDIVKSVFGNGAMAEGWAVYCQRMMLDNGWANNSPEMWLMFYKWSLRECMNVVIDYGIHCLNYPKEKVVNLLKTEAFQEDAAVDEKYHRATVSQVQLCCYFTGASEIFALREAYKKQMGSSYRLKDFHEKFLSYGTAPVKYIRKAMLQ